MIDNIKKLNEMTGAGLLDCKKALIASDNDFTKALEYLKEKGIAKAVKKASRIAAEGLAAVAVANNCAVVIEINSETDFVAKNQLFKDFVQFSANLALQHKVKDSDSLLKIVDNGESYSDKLVALTARIGEKIALRRLEMICAPAGHTLGSYVHNGGKIVVVTTVVGDNEVAKDMAMQIAASNPQYILSADVPPSEANNLTDDAVIENQEYIKDSSFTVKDFLKKKNARLVAFTRYQVGEGLEKRADDFAAEVLRQAGN